MKKCLTKYLMCDLKTRCLKKHTGSCMLLEIQFKIEQTSADQTRHKRQRDGWTAVKEDKEK